VALEIFHPNSNLSTEMRVAVVERRWLGSIISSSLVGYTYQKARAPDPLSSFLISAPNASSPEAFIPTVYNPRLLLACLGYH
jgi:hypothetical protein